MASSLGIVRKFFPNVRKVTDARAPVQIEVTARDTKTSKKKKHAECALAKACQRTWNLDGAVVTRSMVYLVKDKQALRYLLPQTVTREIVAFDRGASFAPGVYTLTKPWHPLGTKKTPPRTTGRKDGSRPATRVHRTQNIRAALG